MRRDTMTTIDESAVDEPRLDALRRLRAIRLYDDAYERRR